MTNGRHIKTLQARSIFLEQRIDENPDKDMGYDKTELSAIKWALEEIENEERNVYQNRAFINGQLVILKKYTRVLEQARYSGNESALEYLAKWSEEITRTLTNEKNGSL